MSFVFVTFSSQSEDTFWARLSLSRFYIFCRVLFQIWRVLSRMNIQLLHFVHNNYFQRIQKYFFLPRELTPVFMHSSFNLPYKFLNNKLITLNDDFLLRAINSNEWDKWVLFSKCISFEFNLRSRKKIKRESERRNKEKYRDWNVREINELMFQSRSSEQNLTSYP